MHQFVLQHRSGVWGREGLRRAAHDFEHTHDFDFDFATDEFLSWVGLDAAHRAAHDVTTFCLEAHVTYHREVRSGDPLRFTTLLLGHDARRIHYFHAMYHATEGYLAATNELMSLHVSRVTRRAAPMTPEVLERLALVQRAHGALERPAQVGRSIGLANRPRGM